MIDWKLEMNDCRLPLIYGYYKARYAKDTLRLIKASNEDFFTKITTFKEYWSAKQDKKILTRVSQLTKEKQLLQKIIKNSFIAWSDLAKESKRIKNVKLSEKNSIKQLQKFRKAISKTMKYYIMFEINEAIVESLRKKLSKLSDLEFGILIQPNETEPTTTLKKIIYLATNNKKDQILDEFGWFPGIKDILSETSQNLNLIQYKMEQAKIKSQAIKSELEKKNQKFEFEIELARKTTHWVNWYNVVEKQAIHDLKALHLFLNKQFNINNPDLSYGYNKLNYLLPEELLNIQNGKTSPARINEELDYRINKGYTCFRDEKGFKFIGGEK